MVVLLDCTHCVKCEGQLIVFIHMTIATRTQTHNIGQTYNVISVSRDMQSCKSPTYFYWLSPLRGHSRASMHKMANNQYRGSHGPVRLFVHA